MQLQSYVYAFIPSYAKKVRIENILVIFNVQYIQYLIYACIGRNRFFL